ncbi:hypothetical protein Ancab_033745 [Ancistrocladus abbreviatus]
MRSSDSRRKRALDSDKADGQPQPIKCNCQSFQGGTCLSEAMVRKIVREELQQWHLLREEVAEEVEHQFQEKVRTEVECALARIDSARFDRRSFPEQIRAPDGRNLQLCFTTIVLQPLYTCETIGGEQGVAIDVVLLDADTGQIVESGPESSLKLNVVPLKGDFNVEDSWTLKEFEDNVVQPREGKCPVLTGDLQVKLKDGVGKLGNVKFTDNSSRQANRRFRLGLMVASDYCEGIRIHEAKTEAFIVLDQRGESYKKHFPPSWDDEVWRLVEIARGGKYCKRLNDAQINTVEDLLRFWARNHRELEYKLKGMPKKRLNNLVEHAKTCIPSGKDYFYSREGGVKNVVIFNSLYQFKGLIANGKYYSKGSLSDYQKAYAKTLVEEAYENYLRIREWNMDQNEGGGASEAGVPVAQQIPCFFSDQHSSPSFRVQQYSHIMKCSEDQNLGGNETEASSAQHNPSFVSHHHSLPSFTIQHPQEQASVDSSPTVRVNTWSSMTVDSDQTQISQSMMLFGASPTSLTGFHSVDAPNSPPYRLAKSCVSNDPALSDFSKEICPMRNPYPVIHLIPHTFDRYGHQRSSIYTAEGSTSAAAYSSSCSHNFRFAEVIAQRSQKISKRWVKVNTAFQIGVFIRKEAALKRVEEEMLRELFQDF